MNAETERKVGKAPDKENPAGTDSHLPPDLITAELPGRLTPPVIAAVIVGLSLIGVVLLGYMNGWALRATGSLILSVGVAVILVAFGGQATFRTRTQILVGAAAIATILFIALENRRSEDDQKRISEMGVQSKQYVRGNIHDVPVDQYVVSLKFARNVLGTTDIYRNQFSFVVFQDEAQEAEVASLSFDPHLDGPPISIAIPTSCITSGMGLAPLDWQIKEVQDGYEIIDRRRQFRRIGSWGGSERPEPCEPNLATAADWPWLTAVSTLLLGQAHAQSIDQSESRLSEPLPVDVKRIAADLNSDVTEIRRSARDALSLAPAELVPDIIAIAGDEPQTYRTKLGVTVALAEMLRRDKSQRELIIPILSDQDRNTLLDYAANPDRTLRIYATEFLFDLGDPEIAQMALLRAAATEDEIARYNWVFVSQDGWWRLDGESKSALQEELSQVFDQSGEKTRELLKAFEN